MNDSRTRFVSALCSSIAVVVIAAVFLGCGDDEDSSSPAGSSPSADQAASVPSSSEDAEKPDADLDTDEPSLGGDSGDSGYPVPPRMRNIKGVKGPEEVAAVETVEGVYDGFQAAVDDGIVRLFYMEPRESLRQIQSIDGLTEICNAMTDEGRRQTVEYAAQRATYNEIEPTCERGVSIMLYAAKAANGLKKALNSKVIAVEVEGGSGQIELVDGKGKSPNTLPLVKQGDEWKIGSLTPPPPDPPDDSG